MDEPLPPEILELLERGKTRRTVILPGAEGRNAGKKPYARTHVEIEFRDEDNLRKCIALLKWSDERLLKLPELLAMWEWNRTDREGMTIHFGTNWYNRRFFEERQNAFLAELYRLRQQILDGVI